MFFKGLIGWFACLLGLACVVGLVVAGVAAVWVRNPEAAGSSHSGLLFLAATSFLGPLGLSSIVAGAIGTAWSPDDPSSWHKSRSWFALIAGAAAAVVSIMFGVALS